MLAILATNNAYAIEFFPLVATNPEWAKTQQGFIGEPITFQHTTLNDNFEPLDFDLLFTTRLPDDTIVDNKTIPVHLNPNETKTVTYQFVPIKEGNFITGVSSEVYPLGESITFSVLDASKNYKRETILIHTIPFQKSCSQVCVNQSETTVNVGTVVEWLNESPNTQTIQSGIYKEDAKGISFSADNRLIGKVYPESKFSFLFLEPGDYKYYFSDHRFLQYAGIIHALPSFKPQIEIKPSNIVRYGDTFTIHAWLDSYEKPDDLRYAIDVIDENGRQVDSTLWFARQDFVYEFDTTHPAYKITKGGTYLIKIERANNIERTGIIETTLPFEIVKIDIIPPPLKQIKSGIKFHNVECNDGLVLAKRGNSERSACVKLDTKIELTVRGWADDDRAIIGCRGDMAQKCFPEDKEEYRKALRYYYYEYEFESKVSPQEFLLDLGEKGEFSLGYWLKGATLQSITKDPKMQSLNVELTDSKNDGYFEITIPRNLLDAKIGDSDDTFVVIADKYEIPYTEITNDFDRKVRVEFNEGTKLIKIIATSPLFSEPEPTPEPEPEPIPEEYGDATYKEFIEIEKQRGDCLDEGKSQEECQELVNQLIQELK
jgi:plastocyanin